MGNPLRAYTRTPAVLDKQALVMRNANSDVDIYTNRANTDTRYLSNSRANGVRRSEVVCRCKIHMTATVINGMN